MSDRIPEVPPIIAPVPDGERRPLWSVMIPSYNCMRFLRGAIESVLAQDPGELQMQIEVVDDYSTDGDVAALVNEVGKGRVGFFRQEKNRGSLRNFETCLNRAKGRWIHLLHGDDMVKPGFYQEIESVFNRFPEAGAAFTEYTHVDEQGHELPPGESTLKKETAVIDDFLTKIASSQLLQPPAIVVKRTVYEKLGSFFAVHYGEDWEMWIRIASNYPVAYSPKCLALYRTGHASNITSGSLATGQNIRDINRVIDIVQAYLPPEKRKVLKNNAKKTFSIHYAMASYKIYPYQRQAAFTQAKGALGMHWNIWTFYWVLKLYGRHVKNVFFRTPKRLSL
jgi:glycosyltransferase involved in cell wall biosynthesis